MRVAVLTNAYPPETRGGAGRIAEIQARMLQNAGAEVRVWHPEIRWFEAKPFERLRRHLADLAARQEIVREIADWKPDILLTHNLTGCGFGTPAAIRRRGIRWIHVLHDVQLFEPSGQVRDARLITPWQTLWAFLRFIAFGRPHLVISPTRWLYEQHRRRGFFWRTPHVVMPNPAPKVRCVERLPHHPLRLLFVGRVSKGKGADILHSLAIRKASVFDIEIAGDASDGTLMRKLAGCVRLLGQLSPEQVLEAMERADALLVPSCIEENQPTVILEAASVGLPVIAARKGGIRETLSDDELLCPERRVDRWFSAIRALAEPSYYARKAEGMRRLAERHDPDAYARQFFSLLKSYL